jgi:hypothetical protein
VKGLRVAAPTDWLFSREDREEAKAAKTTQNMRGSDLPAFAACAILLDMALVFMLCSNHETEIFPTSYPPNIVQPVMAARAFAGWFFPGVIVNFVKFRRANRAKIAHWHDF